MFFHHLAENRALALWALLALIFMILEVIGTKNVLRSFFGIPERFSVFAVTGFNAVLGIYLMGLKEKKMQAKNLIICKEIREYYHDVENLVRDSFWNVYRPDCYEHYLLNQIRNDEDFVSDLDYVMFLNNKIIGQIIFMKALIKIYEGRNLDVMTIGPISIANDFKRQGYGKILIEYALEKARELGCGAVCLEGNIDFYGKVGFDYAKKYGIRYHGLPENEDSSFFLCKELIKGYLDHTRGEYFTPQGYFIDETKVDVFDRQFPSKKKLKMPGQIF